MTIVITGASKGLGYAIAETFAQDGNAHHFFLCARNTKNLNEAARRLQSGFPQIRVYTFVCDISNKEEVTSFAHWVLAQTTQIDVLVNNAGLFVPGVFESENNGTLEALINTNLYSAYYLTKALLPTIKINGSGHIFNVCSVASLQPLHTCFSYSISKYALMGFSKNLREDVKDFNIKVTAVYPGAFVNDSRTEEDTPDVTKIMEAADIAKMIYAAAHLSAQACAEEIVLLPIK